MNLYKKWIALFGLFSVSVLFVLFLINYLTDPFNVFGNNYLKYCYQPNERFIKTEYIKKNHAKYNSYLFGSSRIGMTDPQLIENYIPGSKFYNFTVSSANLINEYKYIKYFIDSKFFVKNIYLQIDLPENFENNIALPTDYLRIDHPDINKINYGSFYIKYLTIFPFKNISGKLILNFLKKEKREDFFFYTTGMREKQYSDKLISEDIKNYIKNEPSLNINKVERKIKGKYLKENINALKSIVALCKKNNIKLIVFTTPHNYNLLNNISSKDYLYFLQEINKLTNYYDFSGYNSVTVKNENYYENSHYRKNIAKLIAARIFSDKSIKVPNDFGFYLTNKNINSHLESLKTQLETADKKYN